MGGHGVPFGVQIAGAIGNRIAAPRGGLGVERRTGRIRVQRLPLGIEVERADMQRLVHVTDQVRQQQQGLAAVANAERRRRGPAVEHLDGGLQGAHHIVIAAADGPAVVVVALDRDVGEMVFLVTSGFASAGVALRRVAAHEIDHPGDAFACLESLTRAVEARVGNIAPAVLATLHILDAVGPG